MSTRLYIVGRVNVGKSTLTNALLGYERSIVFDQPGTTRDSIGDIAKWASGELSVYDTPGVFGEKDLESLRTQLTEQADLCLFVVDASSGITPLDRQIARVIKEVDIPCVLIVNKSDSRHAEDSTHFAALAFDSLEASAAHRRGIDEIKHWVTRRHTGEGAGPEKVKLAIIGRPNTGKSTLMNRLVREKVSAVSPEALTTRDPVFAELLVKGKFVRIMDTAGVRRPRSKMHAVEELSVKTTTRVIERADIIFLCLASDEGITDQDRRLLDLIERKKKPALILLNFWDRLSRTAQRERLDEASFEFARFECLPISSKTGYNLSRLLPKAIQIHDRGGLRTPTSQVNDIIRKIVNRNPPPTQGSRNFNILYTSQVKTKPPTFVFFMNRKDHLPGSYRRYLENEIRRAFGYQSQPIQLFFRAKE